MSNQALTIRHICFTGPNKDTASIEFGHGLNVIYGASETGKSFILEAIDFMLGGSRELRDIPERVGYDRIFLGLEIQDGTLKTLERSTAGNDFRCFDGLHYSSPEGIEPLILGSRHIADREDTLSAFLLTNIGLSNKRIKRNARGETNSLSFRNLAHLCLIPENDIQKRESPIETGQHTSRTSELSVFKLLLTGVDDSSIQPQQRNERESVSQAAKIEVVTELIANFKEKLADLVGDSDDHDELIRQLNLLDQTLTQERNALSQTEQEFQTVLGRRNDLRLHLRNMEERSVEIKEMLTRFALLDEHYNSDLLRLEGVREAGSLVAALSPESCPLCGSVPDAQHLDSDCDGNVDVIVSAAEAESSKILRLRQELSETVIQLHKEADSFEILKPETLDALSSAENDLRRLSPDVSSQRAAYAEIVERKSGIQNALNILKSISELEERKVMIEDTPPQPISSDQTAPVSELSASTLDDFSKLIETILQSWNFPESDRVFFDRTSRDIVISGKPRGSRGKGMRAITHAAFTIGLLRYAEIHELPHPGFVVLDTPLLAYREPEGDEDDLRGTDVQERFYDYLSAWTSRQVIVLENVDPPQSVKDNRQSVFFSKNPHRGRYGLLPHLTP